MIVIRQQANRMFYGGPNCWVVSPLRALSFKSVEEAITYAADHQIVHPQVLDLLPGQDNRIAEPLPAR